MRLEATVPDSRGAAVIELAEELGLSRSQVVDEALALFLRAVLEVRRGRRLMTLDPDGKEPARELATPTLAALEWAGRPEILRMAPGALAKVQAMVARPAEPSRALTEAAKRRRR